MTRCVISCWVQVLVTSQVIGAPLAGFANAEQISTLHSRRAAFSFSIRATIAGATSACCAETTALVKMRAGMVTSATFATNNRLAYPRVLLVVLVLFIRCGISVFLLTHWSTM